MNVNEALNYIHSVSWKGSIPGLSRTQALLEKMGNPEKKLKFIHIAGTNGKGSVIAFLYSVLSGAGYRIGRYVSPTLYSYRGRMEVSGNRISREDFAAYITQVSDVIAAMTKDGYPHPTAFEI